MLVLCTFRLDLYSYPRNADMIEPGQENGECGSAVLGHRYRRYWATR